MVHFGGSMVRDGGDIQGCGNVKKEFSEIRRNKKADRKKIIG
jgi:hypothetical protein